MALITLPSIFLKVRRLDLDVPGQTNRGDWTGTRQHVGLPGAETWFAKAAFMAVSRESEKRLLRAFLMSLRGGQNSFALPVAPAQHPGPNPTVASMQNENTITLSSAAGVVVGMYATVPTAAGQRLVVVTATNVGSFSNRISFEPMLRGAAVVADPVQIMNPYAYMALSNPRNGFDDDEGVVTLEFDAEEI